MKKKSTQFQINFSIFSTISFKCCYMYWFYWYQNIYYWIAIKLLGHVELNYVKMHAFAWLLEHFNINELCSIGQ